MKIPAVIFALLIPTMVPFARRLQQTFIDALKTLNVSGQSFFIFCLLIILALCILYYRKVHQKLHWPLRTFILHSGLLIIIATLSVLMIGKIYVEYIHLLTYGILYFLFRTGFYKGDHTFKAVALSLLFCTAIGTFDEFLQYLHPERVFDLRDFFLNFSGSFIGASLTEPFQGQKKAL